MNGKRKLKVYLVDVDNGELYADYQHSVEKVFTTYRGASQWLINEGYIPHCDFPEEGEISFYCEDCEAVIIEMEVNGASLTKEECSRLVDLVEEQQNEIKNLKIQLTNCKLDLLKSSKFPSVRNKIVSKALTKDEAIEFAKKYNEDI